MKATIAALAMALSATNAHAGEQEIHVKIGTLLDNINLKPYLGVCSVAPNTPKQHVNWTITIKDQKLAYSLYWMCKGNELWIDDGVDISCDNPGDVVRCFIPGNWIHIMSIANYNKQKVQVGTRENLDPIFHGTMHDCDGDNFGGHMPEGFVCRGSGTGIGSCFKPGDHRIISYDVNLGYCHIDAILASESRLRQLRQYVECKGSNPECAAAAFGNGSQ